MAYGKNARRCGALVACALLAAGCGGQAASSSVSRSLPQEEPVSGSLTVYLEQSFADDTMVNYPIRQAIDAFCARYPEVELELGSPVGGISDGEARQAQIAREKAEALENAKKLESIVVKVSAKAGANGRLFGAVTNKEISEALEKQHSMVIENNKIVLPEPIKNYGSYEVKCKFGYEISGIIHVVVSEEK